MTDREQMVQVIKKSYGFNAPKVLSVMLQIPREEFVSKEYRGDAYKDGPVPIGRGQTMSQPYTVAFMTNLLNLRGDEKVLEIGTGSGYQAAILSWLAKKVYTVEIIDELAKQASATLKRLRFRNVQVKSGSGEWGWEEKAPFDAIIITAALEDKVPKVLFDQLKAGGVLVAPLGVGNNKVMTRFTKIPTRSANGKYRLKEEQFGVFHFVPFVKAAGS